MTIKEQQELEKKVLDQSMSGKTPFWWRWCFSTNAKERDWKSLASRDGWMLT